MSPRLGVRETSLLACLRTRAAVCQTAPERFFKMSGPKKFFKSCLLLALRLAVAALPATFLTLCTMDLSAVSPLPLRLFCYVLVFWTYSGPLLGAIFMPSSDPCPEPTDLGVYDYMIWIFPSAFYVFGCFADIIASCIGKRYSVNILTSKALLKHIQDHLDDFSTALFVTALIQIACFIAFANFFAGIGLIDPSPPFGLQKLLRLNPLGSSAQELSSTPSTDQVASSTRIEMADPDSANTRPILNDQPQPPKYEATVVMDLPPPSYESLPQEQLQV